MLQIKAPSKKVIINWNNRILSNRSISDLTSGFDYVSLFWLDRYLNKKSKFPFVDKSFRVLKSQLLGFKKLEGNCIANLIIPKGALIYRDYGQQKIRASVAKVVSIYDTEAGEFTSKEVASFHDPRFVYQAGKTVHPKQPFSLDSDPCKSGIHFFVNLRDALQY